MDNIESGAEVALNGLRGQMQSSLNASEVKTGFESAASFELMYRIGKMMSKSDLVPELFREYVEVKKGANKGTLIKNEGATSNCMLALNIANKMEMAVAMIMGNMMLIEGRLSWSSQFMIAAINRSRRFTSLRFDVIKETEAREFNYVSKEWDDRASRFTNTNKKVTMVNATCIAWAVEKETGERVESPEVSLEMAVQEGWYGKRGSKWQTMPDVMLRYRAASFFGKLYAPDMLMGMPSEDEVNDFLETPAVVIPAQAPAQDKEKTATAVVVTAVEREAKTTHGGGPANLTEKTAGQTVDLRRQGRGTPHQGEVPKDNQNKAGDDRHPEPISDEELLMRSYGE